MNSNRLYAPERYCAPACEELVLESEALICDSLGGDIVDPGTGDDWGNF